MALSDYECLTPEERMRRIGTLLLKVATLAQVRCEATGANGASLTSEKRRVPSDAEAVQNTMAESLDPGGLALLRHYAGIGQFSPGEATQFWNISRTTAYRRLLQMERDGWVMRAGATTATRYRFTKQTYDALQQVKHDHQPGGLGRSRR